MYSPAPTQLGHNPTPQSLVQAPMPQADAERKQKMKEAWKAYRGDFQDPLKVDKDQPNDNVKSNRCAPIVNKGVSFLFGSVLKIEASDEAATSSSDIQDFLDGLWGDDDDKMTLLSQMAMNGGVCGQCFVKLIPAQGQMQYPRIVVLDPMLLRIVTDPEDCSLILAYIIEYPTSNDLQKKQVIARVDPDSSAGIAGEYDLNDTWTITNYSKKGSAGQNASWTQIGEVETWPYPFPPIFCNQNLPNPNEPWGMPDLTPDLIDQNKVLNFVQSNTSRIIKYHAHPKTFAIGVHSSEMSFSVDGVLCLPSENSKLEALAPMEHFEGLLNFAETVRSNMDEQSRVPSIALGRIQDLPRGNITGVALQLLFQPLIEKTIQKQRLYGCLIRAISRAALVLAGKITIQAWEDYRIGLHWANLLPIDDLEAAQTAQILKTIGISDQTLMAELGYTADDEIEKSANEDAKKMTMYSRGQGFPPAPPMQPGMPSQAPASPFIGGGQ